MTHGELIDGLENERLLLGIDRPMARQFYTNVPLNVMQEEVNESPYFEKGMILGSYILAPLLLLASIITVFVSVKWWGIALAPVMVIFYAIYMSLSSTGKSKIMVIFIICVIAFINYFSGDPRDYLALTCIFYSLSLWMIRLVYYTSTIFLRGMIIRSPKAFDFFRDSLVIREVI